MMWVTAAGFLWPGPFDRMADPWFLASVAFYAAGAVLLFKAPANAVGPLMMGFPTMTSVSVLGAAVATAWQFEGLGAAWADTVGMAFATVAIMWLPLLLLYFPSGGLPSPRWRFGPWLVSVGAAVGFVAALLNGGWGGDVEAENLESPLREATGWVGGVLSPLFFVLLIVGFAMGGASLVRRFAASRGIERSQIKWVALAGAFVVGILAVLLFAFGLDSVDETWGELLLVCGIVAIPAAVAIAVLRYRLFDIDRIVSRTVGYVLVLGLLTAVYSIGAVWLPTRLLGGQTPLFVAGSTLAAAAMFNPLRTGILDWVDRRFYRSRYDSERVAEAFSARLREQVDPDRLSAEWLAVVIATLRPTSAAVWVRERG